MNQKMSAALRCTAVCVLACPPYALAQSVLPDAGSLLRQQEQAQKPLPNRLPEASAEEVVRPALQDDKGVAIEVKAIRFTSAVELVPEKALQAQVADAIGKKLDFAGLQALADKITAYLRSQGYLLARAYLPRQDVTSGTIEIAILQGRLDGGAGQGGWQMVASAGTRMDPRRLTAMAERAAPSGAVLQAGELERALLLMNDLPGITVRSRLEPGQAPGSSRVVAEVKEGPRITGNVWADNYGNRSTGTDQLSAALDLNDLGGWGDHGRLALTASEGIALARLGYDWPVGVSGARAEAGYTNMHYVVKQGSGVVAGLKGDSVVAHGGVSYPFVRSRKLNVYGSVGVDRKRLKDDSSAGPLRDKRITVGNVGVNGDSLDDWQGGGLNSWSLQYTSGQLDLAHVAADEAADAATLHTSGGYQKLGWSVSRLQRLPHKLTLLGRVSGQLAAENLDSSEQFMLGGPGGVRAYPGGEAQGDSGWLASLDLRYDVMERTRLGDVQLSAFADVGSICLHQSAGSVAISTATGDNCYPLSGAGLGISVGQAGSHRINVVWAHTLGSNPGRSVAGANADGKSGHNRFWLQAVMWF